MGSERSIKSDHELSIYVATTNLRKIKYYRKMMNMDRKINKYLINKSMEESQKLLKELISDPTKSLFVEGVGGYLAEEERKKKIHNGIISIDEIARGLLKQ